jgi:hypothetical protein
MVTANDRAMMRPGMMPARNNLPMEVSVRSPYRINTTLGGISIP